MFRSSRATPSAAAERWVYPKVFVFVLGAALGLAGIAAHIDWLVTAAVGVLAVGVIMRLLSRDRTTHVAYDDEPAEDDTPQT